MIIDLIHSVFCFFFAIRKTIIRLSRNRVLRFVIFESNQSINRILDWHKENHASRLRSKIKLNYKSEKVQVDKGHTNNNQ